MARIVPPQTPTAEPILKLQVDVESLSYGDLMDLEQASSGSLTTLSDWLIAHAGVTLDEVRAVKARDLRALGTELSAAVKEALDPNE